MLKKIILIVLSVVIMITGVIVYYFNSLHVSDEIIKECKEDLRSSLFSGLLIGYADGSFTLPLQSIIKYENGDMVYADMKCDYLRLINDEKTLECKDADKFCSLISDGDDIYYYNCNDTYGYNVYKTNRDFTTNELFCTVPTGSGYLTADNSVVYYDSVSGGIHKINRIINGKIDTVFETKEDLVPLFAENGIVYLRNKETERIFALDAESKEIKKLPISFVTFDNGFYEICGAEFVSKNIMKVYLSYHCGEGDFEGINVIYLFNTETGRKCKVEI